MLRSLFCEVLEIYGHAVTAAANGEEAILLFNDSIELVITDMNMPRKSGLQTAAALRQRAPNVPIIAMSGQADSIIEIGRVECVGRWLQALERYFSPERHEILRAGNQSQH